MEFSKRLGIINLNDTIQKNDIDESLRTQLWNVCYLAIFEKTFGDSNYNQFYQILWHKFLKLPVDTVKQNPWDNYEIIRDLFFKFEWYKIYDFIEFISQNSDDFFNTLEFKKQCNIVLKHNLSGYRFIDNILSPITSDEEIKEVDDLIFKSQNKYKGVHEHITKSIKLMSNKKSPDFSNSIKESISAVESICKIITKNEKATLGDALNIINQKKKLHPALKNGFSSIYGYTSDADGIRHALLEKNDLSLIDAKYMLVSCSAFINYLIELFEL